jgi:Ca2+-transporting ATPase
MCVYVRDGLIAVRVCSDMVIVDDDFCTIVKAIQHGRAIYANIQKSVAETIGNHSFGSLVSCDSITDICCVSLSPSFRFVLFLIGTNTVQVLFILLCVAIGVPIPLSPLAILFINLATDGMCSVALSMERGEAELMTIPPRRSNEQIISGMRIGMLFVHAISLAIMMVLNFLIGLWWFTGSLTPGFESCSVFVDLQQWEDRVGDDCQDGVARAKTMVFLTLVFAELLRAWTVRNTIRGWWKGLLDNPSLMVGTALSLGLTLLFVLVPGANDVFGVSHTLPYYGWLLSFGGAVFVAICDEALKAHIRKTVKVKARWRMLTDNFTEVITELRAANHKIGLLEQAVLHGKMPKPDSSSDDIVV